MDVTPLIPEGKKIINSYSADYFIISDKRYNHNLLVLPDEIIEVHIDNLNDLEYNLELFKNKNIEVLLLGTGKTHLLPSHILIREFKRIGITCDFMSTGAACRTYNVLLSEGRNVGALLMR